MIQIFGALLVILIFTLNPGLVSALSGVVFLILLRLGGMERSLFNPFYLFSITPLSLMIYNPEISPHFLTPINFEVGGITFLGLSLFILGLYLVKPKPKDAAPNGFENQHFWVFLLIGTIPHIIGIMIAGLPIIAQGSVDLQRVAYAIPIISQFSIFLPLSIICAFQQKKTYKILLSISLSLFFAIIIVSKFSILLSLSFIIFSVVKYGGRHYISSMIRVSFLAMPLILILLFSKVYDLRGEQEQSETKWRQQISTEVDFIETYGDFVYLPYLYATSPWSNLAHTIEVQENYTYGLTSIRPFISLLQLDDFYQLDQKPIFQWPMNTHAFIADFYRDFGFIGVMLLSLLLGVFVKRIYLNAESVNDTLHDGLWVVVGFATLMMFFSNHFTSVGYPLTTFVLFAFYRYMVRVLKKASIRK
jgi:hypothetical protein